MDELETRIRDAATARILARRDEILREREQIREEQARLSKRDRELDRDLVECRAAARFFDVIIDAPTDDPRIAGMQRRVSSLRLSAEWFASEGDLIQAQKYTGVADAGESRLRRVLEMKAREASSAVAPSDAPQEAPEPPPSPAAPSPDSSPKIPRVRDIILDKLQDARPAGMKAAPIRQYIERTYSAQIHSKTVGMTLYRLSQEHLVHRKGQTWFLGPSADESPSMEPENPGADTPGPTQPVN